MILKLIIYIESFFLVFSIHAETNSNVGIIPLPIGVGGVIGCVEGSYGLSFLPTRFCPGANLISPNGVRSQALFVM
jgi:hypothetical protein